MILDLSYGDVCAWHIVSTQQMLTIIFITIIIIIVIILIIIISPPTWEQCPEISTDLFLKSYFLSTPELCHALSTDARELS